MIHPYQQTVPQAWNTLMAEINTTSHRFPPILPKPRELFALQVQHILFVQKKKHKRNRSIDLLYSLQTPNFHFFNPKRFLQFSQNRQRQKAKARKVSPQTSQVGFQEYLGYINTFSLSEYK
eukprot:RCo040081